MGLGGWSHDRERLKNVLAENRRVTGITLLSSADQPSDIRTPVKPDSRQENQRVSWHPVQRLANLGESCRSERTSGAYMPNPGQ